MRLRTDLIERLIPAIYIAIALLAAILFGMVGFLFASNCPGIAALLAVVISIIVVAAATAFQAWLWWRDRDHVR